MTKRKILIDCDTGTDDAIALIAALYCTNIDLVAITTVSGNAPLKYTSQNTLNLVRYLDFDIPVAAGACAPLKSRVQEPLPDDIHGKKGFGGIKLPVSSANFYDKNAVETIIEQARAANGTLEIVAIGPLTNIAISLLLYPELKALISHLWIMGGAIESGNVTRFAEFNIWTDPEAAKLVFSSQIPITMTGLDVTTRAIMNEDDAKALLCLNTPAADMVASILGFMFLRRDNGGEDAYMHDALALAAALCDGCVSCAACFVDIECENSNTLGRTVVDRAHKPCNPTNAEVAVDLDLPRFKKWLYECLCNSAK